MKKKFASLHALLLALVPAGLAAKEVTGVASWYGAEYDGRRMANGQRFNHRRKTIATYEFPLGTPVEITYVSAKGQVRKAVAYVTDRGPHVPGRLFDLSWALFKELETPHKGLINVTVRRAKL